MMTTSVFVFMAGCTLFLIAEGIKRLFEIPGHGKNVEEVEKIYRKRIFEKEEQVKSDLLAYFARVQKTINTANWYFTFSYILVSLMLKMIVPGSSLWKIFGVVFIFYLSPLSGLFVASYENHMLKRDIMERFNAN